LVRCDQGEKEQTGCDIDEKAAKDCPIPKYGLERQLAFPKTVQDLHRPSIFYAWAEINSGMFVDLPNWKRWPRPAVHGAVFPISERAAKGALGGVLILDPWGGAADR
jgi:hypothetical protein